MGSSTSSPLPTRLNSSGVTEMDVVAAIAPSQSPPSGVRSIKAAVDGAAERLAGTATETPRLDAVVLMGFVLGWQRSRLFAHWDEDLGVADLDRFERLVERRMAAEPVAYIRNLKEFLGVEFFVDSRVLIPRPETELLVGRAAAWMDRRRKASASPLVVDVGTGSGAVAIGIKTMCSDARVIATDVSEEALAVARLNASRHMADIDFRRGSLLEPLGEPADLIVANLPYLSLEEYRALLHTSIRYEPRAALTDEADGLLLFEQLFLQVPGRLRPNGALLLEIGAGQSRSLERLASRYLTAFEPAVFSDYAGRPRILQLASPAR